MSGAQVASGPSSSFSSFRVTQFVETNPKLSRPSIASPLSRTNSAQSNGQLLHHGGPAPTAPKPVDAFSHNNIVPSPQTSTMSPPVVVNKVAAPPKTVTPKPVSTALGTSEVAPAVHREGKLGPHKDGRVRNPVPRKLKGKTDEKNGNFAVMHMDMSGTDSALAIPRAEAAQRTSENTANAAKSAQREGYVPVKRRKIQSTPQAAPAPLPPTPSNASQPVHTTQTASALPSTPHNGSTPASAPALSAPPRRKERLSSEETKYEQARLLTLLRSIQPITVVDQICKALAFFGGIPGAPPPEDNSFPGSAQANGSGALFVGWLSEIFPDLDRKEWKPEIVESPEDSRNKRPRGRPKGSKATKARKDKGIKKGPKFPASLDKLGSSREEDNAEDGWVDIGEGDSRMDFRAESLLPGGNTPLANGKVMNNMRHTANEQPGFMDGEDSSNQIFSPTTANMGKRRPGKSNGALNRAGNDQDSSQNDEPQDDDPANQHHTIYSTSTGFDANSIGGYAANFVPNLSTTVLALGGVPQQGGTNVVASAASSNSNNAPPVTAAKRRPKANAKPVPTKSALPAQDLNPPQSFNQPQGSNDSTPQVIAVPSVTGVKRKRARPKAAAAPAKDPPAPVPPLTPLSSVVEKVAAITSTITVPVGLPSQPRTASAGRESPILPPPKRQRKPKESTVPAQAQKKASLSTASPMPVAAPAVPKAPSLSPMPIVLQQTSLMQPSTPSQQASSIQSPITLHHTTTMQTPSALPNGITPTMPQTQPMQHSTMMQPQTSIPQSMSQSTAHGMFPQSISQSMMNPTMTSSDPAPVSRPPTSRSSISRSHVPGGLEAQYDHFASLQQQLDPHSQRLDQNSLTRASPTLGTSLSSSTGYYQPQQSHQQQTQQVQPQQQQHQARNRHMSSPFNQAFPSQQTSHSYTSNSSQNNIYRPTQHNTHSAFTPRQQQQQSTAQQQQQHHHQQQQFNHFSDNSYIDLPALDSIGNNSASLGTYTQEISRSSNNNNNNNGSFGTTGASASAAAAAAAAASQQQAHLGVQVPNGFGDAVMNNSDFRDGLFRIGRR